MNILNKLTYKNLLLNKKRSVVTIVGIILSVALISAVASMVMSFKESLINYEKKTEGDYHYGFYGVSNDEVQTFKQNRKIESSYAIKELGYANVDSKNDYKPYLFVIEMDDVAFNKMGITLTEGRLPKKDGEIVIPRHLKTNGRVDYKVGDKITLDIGKRMSDGEELWQFNPYEKENREYLTKEVTKEYEIVGVIERPGSVLEDYSAPGYTVIAYTSNLDIGTNSIYVRYTKDGIKNQYEVTAGILGVDPLIFEKGTTYDDKSSEEFWKEMEKAKYYYDRNDYLIRLETNAFNDGTMKALTIIASIVIVIIIVTSVFCIKNSFNISVTERTTEYGMLSSVGASSKQIKKSVYYEAFLLGIIGIPLGILSGLLASYILINLVNYLLRDSLVNANSFLIYSVSLLGIIVSILLSIVTLYLSSTSAARKASKTSPIVNIRKNNDIKVKKRKLKCPKIISKLFGIGGKISYKNIKRNKRKYRTTIVSIVVSVSVYVALSYFVNTAFKVIKLEMGDYNYNIMYYSYLPKYEDNMAFVDKVIRLDNIKKYSINSTSHYNGDVKYSDIARKYNDSLIDGEATITLMSLGDEEYRRYIKNLNLSYDEVKDKGILINNDYLTDDNGNKITFDILEVKSGDVLKLERTVSDVDKSKSTSKLNLEIKKTTEIRPLGYENYFGMPIIVVSDEYMNPLLKSNSITVFIDSSNPDKLQDDIDKIIANGNSEDEMYVNNIDASMRQVKNIYLIVAIFLYGFIIVITLIGVTNIFNTISTNMALRKSEFATLKSIGMTKKEFNRMIFLESFLYSFKSLIIGLPIGIGLSYLIYLGLKEILDFTYVLPFKGIIISISVVFILIFALNSYSSKRANQGNIIETIRNENI